MVVGKKVTILQNHGDFRGIHVKLASGVKKTDLVRLGTSPEPSSKKIQHTQPDTGKSHSLDVVPHHMRF